MCNSREYIRPLNCTRLRAQFCTRLLLQRCMVPMCPLCQDLGPELCHDRAPSLPHPRDAEGLCSCDSGTWSYLCYRFGIGTQQEYRSTQFARWFPSTDTRVVLRVEVLRSTRSSCWCIQTGHTSPRPLGLMAWLMHVPVARAHPLATSADHTAGITLVR